MFAIKILYKFIWGTLLTFLPVFLLFWSVSSTILDANLHKKTLVSTDFYSQISTELRNFIGPIDKNKGDLQLMSATLIENFLTTKELKEFFEKNIDYSTSWLKGEYPDWSFYFPLAKMQKVLKQELQKQDQNLDLKKARTNQIKLPFCSEEFLEKFANQNLNWLKNACLSLNSLETPSVLNFLEMQLEDQNRLDTSYSQKLNVLRTWFWNLKNLLPYIFIFSLFLIILSFILGKILGNKILIQLKDLSWQLGWANFSLAVLFLLFLGGFLILNIWINSNLIPGFTTSRILQILLLQLLRLLFNLISPVFWLSLFFLGFSIFLNFWPNWQKNFVIERQAIGPKISQIKQTETKPFDGEFQESIYQDYQKKNQASYNSNFYTKPVEAQEQFDQSIQELDLDLQDLTYNQQDSQVIFKPKVLENNYNKVLETSYNKHTQEKIQNSNTNNLKNNPNNLQTNLQNSSYQNRSVNHTFVARKESEIQQTDQVKNSDSDFSLRK